MFSFTVLLDKPRPVFFLCMYNYVGFFWGGIESETLTD